MLKILIVSFSHYKTNAFMVLRLQNIMSVYYGSTYCRVYLPLESFGVILKLCSMMVKLEGGTQP